MCFYEVGSFAGIVVKVEQERLNVGKIINVFIFIQANGFLRGMVRRVVGTLLAVGRGFLTVGEFQQILASRDIGQAGVPAPARGLCLVRVFYD